jgi:transcriptional regulator with XRE-family HTH domain
MTQTKLADATGMKQSAISRFEKSTDANWKFETLLTLAEALDAQLQIRVVRYEDVIRQFEREEHEAKVSSAFAEAMNRVTAQAAQLTTSISDQRNENKSAQQVAEARIKGFNKAAFNSVAMSFIVHHHRGTAESLPARPDAGHRKIEEDEERYGSDWFQRDRNHEPFQSCVP